LLGAPQDDFRVPLIVLDRSPDFNLPPFKLANVAHFFNIRWEDDHGESTRFRLLAKSQEGSALGTVFHAQHSAAYTLRGAYMLARVGERYAVRRRSFASGANSAHRNQNFKKENYCRRPHDG
jgi:hypothetical protein